jgi:tRNA A-37 threonylcarbamoyl transferase component Bud32
MDDMVGHALGSYQIVEQIGAGAMATVYKGYHPIMERYVAIKVLPDRFARDSTFRARFLREARTIARLEHRYILPIHDFGEDNGTHYLVMRYVTGGSLGELLDAGLLSIERAVQLIGQVGEALAYAHRQGVIHRDIKPANVLIDQGGNVFLSDFGIAKVVVETSHLTREGLSIGTPAYMAPEQAQGRSVDARSDIYALGILLYQAVTGEVPFVAETALAVAFMHIHAPPRPPRQLNPSIPEALERVILRAIAKNPGDRFQMADDMVAALHEALAGSSQPMVAETGGEAATPSVIPTPSLLTPARTASMQPVLQIVQATLIQRLHLGGFWRQLLALLLLLGLAGGGMVLAFPDVAQHYMPNLMGTAPQTQVYISKGTFTINNQEIIVPAGRDVAEAYREAFVMLARQDTRFGPNAVINPNTPPDFIGQPQKVRDEPRGTVYRATMEGPIFIPQH